jgi:hypothetical protein
MTGLGQWLWAIRGASPPDWHLEIRHTRQDRQGLGRTFYSVDQVDLAARTITALGRRSDVYVGVLPRIRRGGTAADVSAGHLVWVDLDDPEAVEAADTFPVRPSMKLSSGNGEHRYWVLDRPTDAAEIVKANRRLAAHLGADPACTDQARVMRAPGTLNHKAPDDPKPCKILEFVTETYGLDQVLAQVPELPAPKIRHLPAGRTDDPVKDVPPPVYFAILAGVEPGRDGKVSCPVHDERTPSCHVFDEPEKGWHCFGCGAGGDVYSLAARLWDMPMQGPGFIDLRKRLIDELIGGADA